MAAPRYRAPRWITNPERTIYSVKRFMGRRFDETTEEAKLVPYKVGRGTNGDARVEIDGKLLSARDFGADAPAALTEVVSAFETRAAKCGLAL